MDEIYLAGFVLLIAILVYIYRKRMITPQNLVPVAAEIERIRLGFMSSWDSDRLSAGGPPRRTGVEAPTSAYQAPGSGGGSGTASAGGSIISVPEVEVEYSYRFAERPYTGSGFLLMTDFLGEEPFRLDFQEHGPDFPTLYLPDGQITGEEGIENFLLSIKPRVRILVDSENPHLSTIDDSGQDA